MLCDLKENFINNQSEVPSIIHENHAWGTSKET